MATSVTPTLIDAVIAAAEAALPSVRVSDAVGVTGSPGAYLAVGWDGDDVDGLRESVSARHTWSGIGNHARDQEGELWLTCGATDGGNNPKTARDAAYALMAAVEDMVRTDPTIGGVVSAGWTRVSSESLRQAQTTKGAHARVSFQLYFKARI